LQVRLVNGALSSRSINEVLAGANTAVIGNGTVDGWEVFQFAEAELVAPDTYLLRQRLRGQAGSDGIMPVEWPADSRFVLLDGTPEQIDLPLNARGVERYFRYGPARRPLDDPSYRERRATFAGEGLRPYPVAHLQCTKDSDGLNIDWIRRTRIGGDSWTAPEVPLGEESERYLVRVFKDGVQLRETAVSGPHWTYGGADQSADGVTGDLRIEVAQMSAVYGTGPVKTVFASI